MTKRELLVKLGRLEDDIAGKCYVGENTTLLHMENRMEQLRQEVLKIIREVYEEGVTE